MYLNTQVSGKNKALSLDQDEFTSWALSLLMNVIFWLL